MTSHSPQCSLHKTADDDPLPPESPLYIDMRGSGVGLLTGGDREASIHSDEPWVESVETPIKFTFQIKNNLCLV